VEAYGIETDSFLGMEIIENEKSVIVHPTFLYESIATFSIFAILMILSNKYNIKKTFRGEITYLYIIVYSLIRILIESIRIDSLMLYGIRISQVLSIILLIIFCHIFIYNVIKKRKTKINSKIYQKT